MADEFKAESVVTEATDMKGAAKIYYTLAVEKIKDVCGTVCMMKQCLVCMAGVIYISIKSAIIGDRINSSAVFTSV